MTSNRRPVRKPFTFQEYIFQYSLKFSGGCLMAGASGMAVLLLLFDTLYVSVPATRLITISLLSGLMFAGIGLVYALTKRAYLFDELMLELRDDEPQKQPEISRPIERSHSMTFDLKNGHPPVLIRQPRPNAFSSWLRQVLADNSKVQFSENQAKMRGWSGEGYQVLIAQLREIGLLHQHDMKNNAPVCTEHGIKLAQRWLNE